MSPDRSPPGEHHADLATRMVDELLDWATALRGVRERSASEPPLDQAQPMDAKDWPTDMQPPQNQPIGFWTARAGQAIRARTRGALKEIGMSQPEWWVLHQLSLHPGGVARSSVIETLGPNDTVEAIDFAIGSAEEKGWLVDNDAALHSTDLGTAQFAQGQDVQDTLQAERTQGITMDDHLLTIQVLQRTIVNVGGQAWHW